MYKFLPIITAGRMASSTLCSKIHNLPNCKNFWEAFREGGVIDKYRGKSNHKVNEGSFYQYIYSTDIKKDITKFCQDNNMTEEFISFKIFNHHLSPNQVNNLLLPSHDEIKVIFLKRNLKDSYSSLMKAKITSNWGTTPEKQKEINLNMGVVNIDIEVNYDCKAFIGYSKRMVDMFNRTELFCKKNKIPYEIVNFEDVISDDFDASKLLF